MRIALDIRPLQNASADRGVGRYVRSLVQNLPASEEYLLLESAWLKPGAIPPGGAARSGVRVGLRRPWRAITLFDQLAMPLLLARRRVDLLHSTFYALPRFRWGAAKLVLTVHDLIPILVPGSVGSKNREIFRRTYRSARGADAVVVPSSRTADDLMRSIGLGARTIRIIPMGVGPPFGPEEKAASPDGAAGRITRLQAEGHRVLLYVGGFDPSKNVPFLIDALAALDDGAATLCIAGEPGAAAPVLAARIGQAGLSDRVQFLGRLTDEDLASAYRRADLFVSASSYEGFGLPALEAMACGCPVVALEGGTVAEVLAGAAIGVADASPAAFARAVRSVLEDAALRRELSRKGIARASELTWERTARATHALYRELCGGS